MNRREFCRNASLVSGSIIISPLINACAARQTPAPDSASVVPTTVASPDVAPTQMTVPATATARVSLPADPVTTGAAEVEPLATPTSPAPTTATSEAGPNQAHSRIALVKSHDRATGVAQAINLLNPESLRGKDVLLKPNFNSADPSPGSTHPEILQSLLAQLVTLGAGQITLADRSGMGDTRRVMEKIGILDLVRDYNCQTVVFDELAEQEWVIYRQSGSHWQDGFPVPKMLLESQAIVQTCNLKTHRYGGHFTLSLKNSVGFVAKTMEPGGYNYMTELHNSPYQRLMIAEINAAYEPDLVVMDGVEAFVEGGPAEGKRVNPGVVLAGRDRVALDAAGVAILRMFGTTPEVSRGRIFEQEQIARAAELGLGASGPEMIDFVTADPESAAFAEELGQLLLA